MKYFAHVNTAVRLLQQYDGSVPFGIFIRQFFSEHKKHGSKDRKNIQQLCYAFFRLGKALLQLPTEERVQTGLFLCSQQPNELLQHLKPEWNEKASLSIKEKLDYLSINIQQVFPWQNELSEHLDHNRFGESFFIQPDLFLRLRPGKEQAVKSKLQQAGLSFHAIAESCIALPNASKLDGLIEADKEAVIQDYSSQRVGEFFNIISTSTSLRAPGSSLRLWDACAASGGKSILAYDILPHIDLTVSDVRKSILANLEKRFASAGIKRYHSFIADLAHSTLNIQHSLFDIIITDVPCSGSGTWSRTPEQLYFFDAASIDRYSALQKKIVHNAIPHLKPGGWFLYCTCSVFKKENENMVAFIQQQHHLKLHKMELLKGYDHKADTLFAALFTT